MEAHETAMSSGRQRAAGAGGAGRARGAARGARAPPGHRGGVARRRSRYLTDVGRADEFILLSDVTRTSVLIDAHVARATTTARRRATSRARSTWTTRRGARRRSRSTRTTRGWATPTCCSCAARVTSTDGDAAARRGHRHLADRARAAATTSGTSASPSTTSAARFGVEPRTGAYEFQTMLPKPYTVPTEGPVGRYLEAVGQHPWRPAHIHFKVDAPRPPAARHAGVLPRRPVPGERHHRRGQGGARAPASSGRGRRTSVCPIRHRACGPAGVSRFASCSLGERRFAGAGRGRRRAPAARRRRARRATRRRRCSPTRR